MGKRKQGSQDGGVGDVGRCKWKFEEGQKNETKGETLDGGEYWI